MPVKTSDSVRKLGQASIGTDKLTRDNLKQAAENAGMTLSDYLRNLSKELVKGKQASMIEVNPLEKVEKSLKETSELAQIIAAILILGQPASWIEEVKKPGTILSEILPEARYQTDELLVKLVESLKKQKIEVPQAELKLNGETAHA